jgi:hypothetical protein
MKFRKIKGIISRKFDILLLVRTIGSQSTVLLFFRQYFQVIVQRSFSVSFVFFSFISVCFETDLFVSVVSKWVRNTETNRKKLLLVSRNKHKMNRNRFSFGLFRFEPKKKIVCFEDTLVSRDLHVCFCYHSIDLKYSTYTLWSL